MNFLDGFLKHFLVRNFTSNLLIRNVIVYNFSGGNNSYTVPQLQRRQLIALQLIGPESDHTDRYSVRLPNAACTCE